jgi:peptide/nickel transport system substrate-binding protein
MRLSGWWLAVMAGVLLLTSCTGGSAGPAPTSAGPAAPAERPSQPKRIIVGSREAAPLLSGQLDSAADVIEELVSAGMVRFAPTGEPLPLLAEAVPSLENNQWKVFPDGRMETTWRLKEGLRWHDGTPLTADDVVFGIQVGLDRNLPEFGHVLLQSVEGARATDARTVVVDWKQLEVQATILSSWEVALPLPKHLLEPAYLNSKEAFTQHRYWSHEFVHAGPFKVRQFVPTERLLVEANPDYVLGRPKVDEIEVRFIPDANALIANLLSGDVHLSIGAGAISVDQAQQIQGHWEGGKMAIYPYQGATVARPQYLNPDPAVLADVRFRRALAHAIDRDALNQLVTSGLAPTSGFSLPPGAPEFAAINASVVQYSYDPRRAGQLIEEAGLVRSGDQYRDPTGREITVQVQADPGGPEEQAALFLANSWERLGVKSSPQVGPRDREFRANRPAFEIGSHSFAMAQPRRLTWFLSREIPTAENRYRGSNFMRYANPELDALVDRFFVTIPEPGRIELLKQIAHLVTDQAVFINLYHPVFPALVSNRVQDFTPRTVYAQTWDAQLWDIR